jgi:nucleoside-diphosphate-sugar epimerase
MQLLVTGGNGLLGRHLITALLERGERVRVLALVEEDASWLEARGVIIHRGDIRHPETLLAPLEGVDAVFNLAGMMGLWRPLQDYRAVNVTGATNVCRVAQAAGVHRVVHVSSWTVYGMDRGQPCTELSPIAPFLEPYAMSKAEGDRAVQRLIAEEELPAVIVRPGTFFGPGDRLHFGRMADRLVAKKAIIVGSGANALPFVDVTDVVQGLILALDSEAALGQAFNITTDQPLTQQEFFDAMAEEIGVAPPRVHVPYQPLYAAGYGAERLATFIRMRRQPPLTRLGVKLFGTDNRHAVDKARRVLGYAPQLELREGIRQAAAWYQDKRTATV